MSYIDALKSRDDGFALFAILHELDIDQNVFGDVSGNSQSCVSSSGETCVAPWTAVVNAAMVYDKNRAIKGFPDGVCGLDIVAHVLVAVFRTNEASVECVEHKRYRLNSLHSNIADEVLVLPRQVGSDRH